LPYIVKVNAVLLPTFGRYGFINHYVSFAGK